MTALITIKPATARPRVLSVRNGTVTIQIRDGEIKAVNVTPDTQLPRQ